MDSADYERFLMLLYICNDTSLNQISRLNRIGTPTLSSILETERQELLVDIGVYALMPNHFHLLLRERKTGGITLFMRRVGTAYAMYFNLRYERVGALFSARFKAIHVAEDLYMRRLVNYIHANPAELFEPGWKEGLILNETNLRRLLLTYPYSSLPDYTAPERLLSVLVSKNIMLSVLEIVPGLDSLIQDARDFSVRTDLTQR